MPSRLNPLLTPVTLVFTNAKFASFSLTEVSSCTSGPCAPVGVVSKDANGMILAQPVNNRHAARATSTLLIEPPSSIPDKYPCRGSRPQVGQSPKNGPFSADKPLNSVDKDPFFAKKEPFSAFDLTSSSFDLTFC